MAKFLIIATMLTTGAIYSWLNPIYLPISMINGIDTFVQALYLWDTILPVITLFQAFAFFVLITICIWGYKLFKLMVS